MKFEEAANKYVRPAARGVVLCDGFILVLKNIESPSKHFVLPGGGIEFNESAKQALVREVREEVNLSLRKFSFMGCYEQSFLHPTLGQLHDLTLLFKTEISLAKKEKVKASESCYEVHWVKLADLANINLMPPDFKTLIPKLLREDFSAALMSSF